MICPLWTGEDFGRLHKKWVLLNLKLWVREPIDTTTLHSYISGVKHSGHIVGTSTRHVLMFFTFAIGQG